MLTSTVKMDESNEQCKYCKQWVGYGSVQKHLKEHAFDMALQLEIGYEAEEIFEKLKE